MKKVILVLIIMFISTTAFCLNGYIDRETLKGIKKFYVNIDIEHLEGLTEEQIRTDVELKLRMAGISIDNSTQYENPELRVIVVGGGEFPEGFHSFGIRVEVRQAVKGVEIDFRTITETWSVWAVGMARPSEIRDFVKDYIDTFLNAYLSVNPK